MLWVFWLVLVLLPVFSVGDGGELAEGLVGPVVIVPAAPVFEDHLGFEDVGEVLGVEALVSLRHSYRRRPLTDSTKGVSQGDPGSFGSLIGRPLQVFVALDPSCELGIDQQRDLRSSVLTPLRAEIPVCVSQL